MVCMLGHDGVLGPDAILGPHLDPVDHVSSGNTLIDSLSEFRLPHIVFGQSSKRDRCMSV